MATRLDIYIAEYYDFTRNKAQQLIKTGLVTLNGVTCFKCSLEVSADMQIRIAEDRRVSWVSRSAEKLAGFIELEVGLGSRIHDALCLDVGSSTGGFTQVLLQYGARRVDAVDVGTDQLHESLRSDTRVYSYEQTDIRDFVQTHPLLYDMIVCDASFISLHDILDSILSVASTETDIILLFKPQFEVGRHELRRTGVPRDVSSILAAQSRFEQTLLDSGLTLLRREKSSLMGEAGNQEWLYWIKKSMR